MTDEEAEEVIRISQEIIEATKQAAAKDGKLSPEIIAAALANATCCNLEFIREHIGDEVYGECVASTLSHIFQRLNIDVTHIRKPPEASPN